MIFTAKTSRGFLNTTFAECRTQIAQCRLQTLKAIRSRVWERTNGIQTYEYICTNTYLYSYKDVEVCVPTRADLTLTGVEPWGGKAITSSINPPQGPKVAFLNLAKHL